MFFSFDGIDGVGKSTQIRLFQEWLVSQGHDVVTCRDPGSTPLGETVREILLNSNSTLAIHPRTEMLLYMAARSQLVEEVIRPALEKSRTVISDRFLLANIVYQGYAGGTDIEEIREAGRIATAGISPDCIFLFDMPPTKARERLGREPDRIEQRGDEYREKLRSGFLAEAKTSGGSVHVVNADRSVEDIQSELRTIALRLFG